MVEAFLCCHIGRRFRALVGHNHTYKDAHWGEVGSRPEIMPMVPHDYPGFEDLRVKNGFFNNNNM
jgi:hypothetical protein